MMLVVTSKHNIETDEIGVQVDATPAKPPHRVVLDGRVVSVVPLDAVAHAETLYEASRGEQNEGLWRIYSRGRLLVARRLMLIFEKEPVRRILCSLPFLKSLQAMRLVGPRICASSLRIE
jgi:hypothetical protein